MVQLGKMMRDVRVEMVLAHSNHQLHLLVTWHQGGEVVVRDNLLDNEEAEDNHGQ